MASLLPRPPEALEQKIIIQIAGGTKREKIVSELHCEILVE